MSALNGTVGLFIVIALLVLAVLWFFLPFAIFGTKDILYQILAALKENNQKLDQLIERSKNEQS